LTASCSTRRPVLPGQGWPHGAAIFKAGFPRWREFPYVDPRFSSIRAAEPG
jgi:hypothetical protein